MVFLKHQRSSGFEIDGYNLLAFLQKMFILSSHLFVCYKNIIPFFKIFKLQKWRFKSGPCVNHQHNENKTISYLIEPWFNEGFYRTNSQDFLHGQSYVYDKWGENV